MKWLEAILPEPFCPVCGNSIDFGLDEGKRCERLGRFTYCVNDAIGRPHLHGYLHPTPRPTKSTRSKKIVIESERPLTMWEILEAQNA